MMSINSWANFDTPEKEWKEFRAAGIGSSDVAAILGISPWMTTYALWEIKTGRKEQKDISNNWAVKRGIENEPRARAEIELFTKKEYLPQLCIHPEYDFMRVSLDGRNGDELIEIKVPSREIRYKALAGMVEPYYMVQIQYQLMVSGCKRALYYCFDSIGHESGGLWVEPDLEFQTKIREAVIDFWQLVKSGTEPEIKEKDYIELDDRSFLDAAKEYRDITTTIRLLEEKLEAVKGHIIEQAKVHPAIRGGGIQVTGYTVKGNVDYSKIEALKSIDLEQYRKPSRRQYKITIQGTT